MRPADRKGGPISWSAPQSGQTTGPRGVPSIRRKKRANLDLVTDKRITAARLSSDNTSPWILGSVLSHLKPLRDDFGDWRAVEINFRAVEAYVTHRCGIRLLRRSASESGRLCDGAGGPEGGDRPPVGVDVAYPPQAWSAGSISLARVSDSPRGMPGHYRGNPTHDSAH
jgi:hypothetical protein